MLIRGRSRELKPRIKLLVEPDLLGNLLYLVPLGPSFH